MTALPMLWAGVWLSVAGGLLFLPHSAWAQAQLGLQTCSVLAALGLLLIALWMLSQRSQPRRLWPGVALALAVWQGLAMQWLGAALAPGAQAALLPLLALMLVLNLAPLLALAWGLGKAIAALQKRLPLSRHAAFEAATWPLSWPLAWAAWALLREGSWWGGNYAGLALGLLDVPGLAQGLPVLGASLWEGLCWALALLLALGLRALWAGRLHGRWGTARGLPRVQLAGLGLLLVAASVLTFSSPRWTQATGAGVPVLAVQPGADTAEWDLAARDAALALLHTALQQAAAGTLVVTPETFLREPPPRQAVGVWTDLLALVQARQATLLLGMPLALREGAELGLMNTVLMLSPQGAGANLQATVYAKQRLAPAGEALPWPTLLRPLLASVWARPERPDLLPGPAALSQPLFAAGHTVGVSICHELAFGSHLQRLSAGADWLLNVADDSWITHPDYRLQAQRMARLRALELGKPLLRISQGAQSLLVGANGQVLVQAPAAQRSVWAVSVQPHTGSTPYGRWATGLQIGTWAVTAALLLAGGLTHKVRRLRAQPSLQLNHPVLKRSPQP